MDTNKKLHYHTYGLLSFLAIQYALGMYANLFVEFSKSADIHTRWIYAMGNPFVALHVVIGTGLLLGAVALVVRAAKLRAAAWKIPAYLGLVGILLSWVGGERFVSTQIDIFSYLMSLGFLLAVFAYCWGLTRKG